MARKYKQDTSGNYLIIRRETGTFYFGKGNKDRMNQHFWVATHYIEPDMVIDRAIKKHGVDAFDFFVTHSGLSDVEAFLNETEWIRRLRDEFGFETYNCNDGGRGGVSPSPEVIKKQSDKRKVYWAIPGNKERLSKRQKGVLKSEAHKEAIRQTVTGYKHTVEARAKMGVPGNTNGRALKGSTQSDEHKLKKATSKRITMARKRLANGTPRPGDAELVNDTNIMGLSPHNVCL